MTFFSSTIWTLISFVLFTALVAIISSWKTKDDKLDSAEGYFLAGRALSDYSGYNKYDLKGCFLPDEAKEIRLG